MLLANINDLVCYPTVMPKFKSVSEGRLPEASEELVQSFNFTLKARGELPQDNPKLLSQLLRPFKE